MKIENRQKGLPFPNVLRRIELHENGKVEFSVRKSLVARARLNCIQILSAYEENGQRILRDEKSPNDRRTKKSAPGTNRSHRSIRKLAQSPGQGI